ncbi:hypothetical protein HK414_22515 [Ramlibacter terrae]|uniref:DUF4263 domain-containing protein n=1 Tax=Ramlibacter terrae TaxID=2732511 RepID=A0ABX6P542_9BURK|nr:hypothetical protein HK414_22515 [Ramlibacter terrae]
MLLNLKSAMNSEAEIQAWMVEKARSRQLSNLIVWGCEPADAELRAAVQDRGSAPYVHSHTVQGARRILDALIEPEFLYAEKNVSPSRPAKLLPDLVLRDVVSGAFIVIELKRERTAARQFATELLAYANCLRVTHPGAAVFLVPVSTSWRPLEKHAVAQMMQGRLPVLPLEIVDVSNQPLLRVRSDLLVSDNAMHNPASALIAETKTFLISRPQQPGVSGATINQLTHALRDVAHRAEKETASGFALAWHVAGHDSLFVSVAVSDPCHTSEQPFDGKEPTDRHVSEEEFDRALSNDDWEFRDDAATRLLLGTELGVGIPSYSSEWEGPRHTLEARLLKENADVWGFEGFGELGAQLHCRRALQRNVFAPLLPDLITFSPWHPVTWLPVLDSVIVDGPQDDANSAAARALRAGKVLGSTIQDCRRLGVRRFRRGASEARVLAACADLAVLTRKPAQPFVQQVAANSIYFVPPEQWWGLVQITHELLRTAGEGLGEAFEHGYRRAGKG